MAAFTQLNVPEGRENLAGGGAQRNHRIHFQMLAP